MRNVTRSFLFLFFLVVAIDGFSQDKSEMREVLDTVKLHSKISRKTKIKKIELDGESSFGGFANLTKIVSLVRDIPDGQLQYVRFYFNSGIVNFSKKKTNIDYKDVELGLLVYEMAEDGSVGNLISENEVKFTIKHNHRGEFEVDVKPLHLFGQNLYIGFALISGNAGTENDFYLRFTENSDAKTFAVFKSRYPEKWSSYKFKNPFQLKMVVGVEVEKL